MLLAWDTGDYFVLMPFKADFIDYLECVIPVKDVTNFNKVIGIGIKIHKFKISRDMIYVFCTCHTIYLCLRFNHLILRLFIIFMVATVEFILT